MRLLLLLVLALSGCSVPARPLEYTRPTCDGNSLCSLLADLEYAADPLHATRLTVSDKPGGCHVVGKPN